jgi:hypothetical protein
MEKSILKWVVFLLLITHNFSFSQETLITFKVSNDVYINDNNPVYVGQHLSKKDSVELESDSDFILIDANGHSYKISEKGIYNFEDFLTSKIILKGASLNEKYFKYVYEKFMNIKEQRVANVGAVMRGNTLMRFPENYGFVGVNNGLRFEWNNNSSSHYHLWIRNAKSKKLVAKFKVEGNLIEIKNSKLFKANTVYEWTVSDNEFENLEKLIFFTFKTLNKKELNKIQQDEFEKAKSKVEFILKQSKLNK